MMLTNPIRPTIYTFGFGADYNSETLAAIAQAGQGQSSFIEDAESIAPALASALGGLMTISAQNVELTFTPKVTGLLLHLSAYGTSECPGFLQTEHGFLHCSSAPRMFPCPLPPSLAVGSPEDATDLLCSICITII